MVGHAEQAAGIRRQIDTHDICLLVQGDVDEAGVLRAEAIVFLVPDVTGQEVIQGRSGLAPGQLAAGIQPFGMLVEHGTDDVREGLVAGEEAMPAGQQITLQPFSAIRSIVMVGPEGELKLLILLSFSWDKIRSLPVSFRTVPPPIPDMSKTTDTEIHDCGRLKMRVRLEAIQHYHPGKMGTNFVAKVGSEVEIAVAHMRPRNRKDRPESHGSSS